MGMNFIAMFLMYVLAGGASDLLDVVPSDLYWDAKGARATPELLAAELAPPAKAADLSALIDELGSDDAAAREAAATKIRAAGKGAIPQLEEAAKSDNPQVSGRARRLIADLKSGDKVGQVRRLIAIRTAGERKVAALLPRLKELTKSDDAFVADYAACAVAAIEGNKYERPHPATGDDAWLLPAGCRIVAHLQSHGGKAATAEDFKTLMEGPGFGFGGGDPNDPAAAEERKKAAAAAMQELIATVEKLGNIRADGVTLGVSGNIGPQNGFVVTIVRGRYDAKAAAELMATMQPDRVKRHAVAGVDALDMGNDGTFLFPDDTRFAYVGGPAQGKDAPFEAVAGALKTGKQLLKESPEMAKLLGQGDVNAPLWAAMHVTDAFRQADLFEGMEWVTLTSKRKDEGLEFRFDAKGQDPAKTAAAVGKVNQGLDEGRKELREMAQRVPQPQLKKVAEAVSKMLDGARCNVDEKDPTTAHLTGEIEVPPVGLLGLMFMTFGF